MAASRITPSSFVVAYNQEVPSVDRSVNKAGRAPSVYREPCTKVLMNDASNARLRFEVETNSRRAYSSCSNYVRKHGLPLAVKRFGKDVFITRRPAAATN